jgi:hypothetical protein
LIDSLHPPVCQDLDHHTIVVVFFKHVDGHSPSTPADLCDTPAMFDTPSRALLALAAVGCLLLFFKLLRIGRRAPGLPPGPPTIPVLGNLHLVSLPNYCNALVLIITQMPTKRPHLQFQKWAQEYG